MVTTETNGLNSRIGIEALANIVYTRENMDVFGRAIHDSQEFHSNEERAKKRLGLRTTPVRGTRFAAIAGRLGREAEAFARTQSSEYQFIGQNVSFRDPVFPGDKLIWSIGEVDFLDKQQGTISIPIEVKNKGEAIRVKIENLMARTMPEIPEIQQSSLVYRQKIEPNGIPRGEIIGYHNSIGEEAPDRIVPMYLVSRSTGTMVEFLDRLNRRFKTDYIARNIRMNSLFHREFDPSQGTQIEVYEISTPRKAIRGFWKYEFRGVVRQDDGPVVTTDIKTFTDGKLETRAFRPEFGLAA